MRTDPLTGVRCWSPADEDDDDENRNVCPFVRPLLSTLLFWPSRPSQQHWWSRELIEKVSAKECCLLPSIERESLEDFT